jgi:putative ABC transport system permease protein
MIRQSVVMTALNLLSLPQRWGSALIDVFGVACVVAVFVGLFAVVASYQALLVTGSDDSVLMVMKSGAEAENESSIAQDATDAIVTAATAADPAVIISPESSRLIAISSPWHCAAPDPMPWRCAPA